LLLSNAETPQQQKQAQKNKLSFSFSNSIAMPSSRSGGKWLAQLDP